jgi:hypothetical protein
MVLNNPEYGYMVNQPYFYVSKVEVASFVSHLDIFRDLVLGQRLYAVVFGYLFPLALVMFRFPLFLAARPYSRKFALAKA